MNVFNGVGRLGKNPEKKEVNGGKIVSKFSIAISESYKDGDEWKEKTEWINCEAWRDLDWLKKGDLVSVEGKMKTTKHEDKYYTSITVFKLNRLAKSGENKTDQKTEVKKSTEEIEDLPF